MWWSWGPECWVPCETLNPLLPGRGRPGSRGRPALACPDAYWAGPVVYIRLGKILVDSEKLALALSTWIKGRRCCTAA